MRRNCNKLRTCETCVIAIASQLQEVGITVENNSHYHVDSENDNRSQLV